MQIAIVTLPAINTPINGKFRNLHGFWNSPEFILSFCVNLALIEYFNEEDYVIKREIIRMSYEDCINQFYRENAL